MHFIFSWQMNFNAWSDAKASKAVNNHLADEIEFVNV